MCGIPPASSPFGARSIGLDASGGSGSSVDPNEGRGSNSDQSASPQPDTEVLGSPSETPPASTDGTTRPKDLARSIQDLAVFVTDMQGVLLTEDERDALEQLMATLAELLIHQSPEKPR